MKDIKVSANLNSKVSTTISVAKQFIELLPALFKGATIAFLAVYSYKNNITTLTEEQVKAVVALLIGTALVIIWLKKR